MLMFQVKDCIVKKLSSEGKISPDFKRAQLELYNCVII